LMALSALAYSSYILWFWLLGGIWHQHTFYPTNFYLKRLPTQPNVFCFLKRGIMESTLCVLVDCLPVWSCLQVFNLGFPLGWGYVEEDSVIYKELFSWRIFGISKLFWKIILMFIQNKHVLKNSSDYHG